MKSFFKDKIKVLYSTKRKQIVLGIGENELKKDEKCDRIRQEFQRKKGMTARK